VKCPKKKDSANLCNNYDDNDDARAALENLNSTVDEANRSMTRALESGMDAIVQDALLKAQPIRFVIPRPPSPSRYLSSVDPGKKSGVRFEDTRERSVFEEDFREYLTMKYHDCIGRDHYMHRVLQCFGLSVRGVRPCDQRVSRPFILFLAAANFTEAQRLAVDDGDRARR